MPDPSAFQGFALLSIVVTVIIAIVALLIAYGVIYLAVKHALRAHARWMFDGGPEGELRRDSARALR